jgi:osmotically-inducible protein OsmY
MSFRFRHVPLAALAAAVVASTLAGCAPLLVGGAAVGTALMVTDRRTSGAQIDDEAIELRASARMKEAFGDRAHVNAASYNRQVLLTGEVPTEQAKQQAEQIAARVENVRGVVNDLAVMAPTSLAQRSNDTYITGKVRASFVDASDLQSNAFRVTTERGVVYLMGRVTPREADRGTTIARQIGGVQKVVRVFELVEPAQAQQSAAPVTTVAPAATAAPAAPAGATATPAAASPAATGTPLPPAGAAR